MRPDATRAELQITAVYRALCGVAIGVSLVGPIVANILGSAGGSFGWFSRRKADIKN
jgi:uncharacterized membrane protein